MLTFFAGCVGLFSHIFAAALHLEYFRFLVIIVVVLVAFGLFAMLSRGTRKL